MRTRPRKSGWLIIAVLQLSACSHYRMPVAVLDTPEVGGADRVGRVEMLSIHSGVNLSDPGSLQKDGTTKLGMSVPLLMVGFTRSFSDKLEAGIRIQPSAPPVIRAKYQFVGLPEAKAERRGFSLAASAGGGLLFGNYFYILGQAALHGGYRIWQNHLFSLSPMFSFSSLSADTFTGTGILYGAALGYQYDWAALGWRIECAYARGTFATSVISGFYPSLMFIWKI